MTRHLRVFASTLQVGDVILDPFDDEQEVTVDAVTVFEQTESLRIAYGNATTTVADDDPLVLVIDDEPELRRQIQVLTDERDAALAQVDWLAGCPDGCDCEEQTRPIEDVVVLSGVV